MVWGHFEILYKAQSTRLKSTKILANRLYSMKPQHTHKLNKPQTNHAKPQKILKTYEYTMDV